MRASYLGLIELAARVTSGIAVFVPAAWILAAQGSRASAGDWLVLTLPAALWLVAFAPALRYERTMLQALCGFALLVSPFFLQTQAQWIQPTVVAFGIMVAAAFCLTFTRALLIVVLGSAVDLLVSALQLPGTAFVSGDLMARTIGALLAFLAGIGLVVTVRVWRGVAEQAEADEVRVRELVARAHEAEQARLAVEGIRRRIHETILNTLTGLSMKSTDLNVAQVQDLARRGVEQLDSGIAIAEELHVSQVIDGARAELSPGLLRIEARISKDPLLPAQTVQVVRDALVEALRNIERHAQTDRAWIDVSMTDRLEIVVTDLGAGLDPEYRERFGMRHALRAGIEEMGGRAQVESLPDGGTRVALSIPNTVDVTTPEYPIRHLAETALVGRLGLLGTNAFLAMAAIPLTLSWPRALLIQFLVYAFVLANTGLAFAWRTRARIPLSFSAAFLAAGIALAALPAAAEPGLSQSLGWLIIAVTGGGALPLVLAQRRTVGLLICFALVSLPGMALALHVPTWAQAFPVMGAAIGTLYIGSVISAVSLMDNLLERRRQEAIATWHSVSRDLAAGQARLAALSEWELVSRRAQPLLTGVADGSLDPISDAVRDQAAELAVSIRASLSGDPQASLAQHRILDHLRKAAGQQGAEFSAEILHQFSREDTYPSGLLETVVELTQQVGMQSMRAVFMVEGDAELLVIRLDRIGTFARSMPSVIFDDCTMEIEQDDAERDVLVIIVARPSSSARCTDS